MEDLCLTYTACFVVGICPSSTFSATAAKLSQSIIVLQITPWSTCKKMSKNLLERFLRKKYLRKKYLWKKYLRKKYLRKKFLQKKSLGKKYLWMKSLQNWIVFKTELSLMQNWIIQLLNCQIEISKVRQWKIKINTPHDFWSILNKMAIL